MIMGRTKPNSSRLRCELFDLAARVPAGLSTERLQFFGADKDGGKVTRNSAAVLVQLGRFPHSGPPRCIEFGAHAPRHACGLRNKPRIVSGFVSVKAVQLIWSKNSLPNGRAALSTGFWRCKMPVLEISIPNSRNIFPDNLRREFGNKSLGQRGLLL